MPQLCKYFCIKIQIKILSRIDYSLSLWVVLGVAKSRTQLSYWTTTKWKKFCLFFFPASLIIGTTTQTFRTIVICGEMSITCLSSIYAINIGILKLYTQFQWKVTKEAWKDILTAQCVCVCWGWGVVRKHLHEWNLTDNEVMEPGVRTVHFRWRRQEPTTEESWQSRVLVSWLCMENGRS